MRIPSNLLLFLLLSSAPDFLALGETGAPRQLVLDIQDRIAAGNLETAERELLEAMRQYPTDGGLFNLRGIIFANRNQLAPAESDFSQAIRLSPRLVSAYLNLGRIYEIEGANEPAKLDSAIELYQSLLRRDSTAANVRLQLAKLLETRARFRASLSQLSALPPKERTQALAYSVECADLLGIGDHARALTAAANLLHAPDASVEDVMRVLPLLQDSRLDRPILELAESFLLHRDLSSDELEKLASADLRVGKLKEARGAFELLAAKEPQSSRPLVSLADVAYKQQDLEGALGYLAHARELAPSDAGIHFFFGIVCIELNLPLEAKKSLQKALEIDPGNPDYNYARGSVELQGRAAWDAIPYFQKYVAARPNDPRGHFALGVAEFGSKDYQSAAAEMQQVASNKETMAGAEYFLGRMAKADGDWSTAADHLARSIDADRNYAESHAELAVTKLHLNDIAAARREIDLAFKANPDSYLVNSDLLVVYQWTKDARETAQRNRLDRLDAERSQKQELMLRTIQIRH